MSRAPLAFGVALLVSPLLGACGHDCTLMYAPDGLTVVFAPALTTSGVWGVELAGEVEAACEVTLPVPDPSDMTYTPCGDTEGVDLRIAEDGLSVRALTIEASPPSATVVVEHDGAPVAEETFTPVYTQDEPNGEGCGVRSLAEVELDTDG